MKRGTALIVAAFMALFMFSSCKKEQIGKVKIRFKNESAFDLKAIKVQDRNVGNLKAGESSKWIHFEHFSFDSGFPAEDIQVTKESELVFGRYMSFCQTQFRTVTDGKYDIKIQVWVNMEGKPSTNMR